MKGLGQRIAGPVAAAVAALVLGLGARTFLPSGHGWAFAAAALLAMLAIVAANAYRVRRDPALLLLAAGGVAAAVGFASFGVVDVYDAHRSSGGPLGEGLRTFSAFMPFVGALALAACLALMVPWRDRRGRPPLQVWTVVLGVGVPVVAAAILLLLAVPQTTTTTARVLAGLVMATALVAAARAIARGGWYGWIGGGAFAIAIANAGVLANVSLDSSDLIAFASYAWLTLLPSVAAFLLLLGVLDAQRAEASRLRRASDRAAQVMEGRAEIASIVAHDVRGPAGTIRSVAGSLRTSYTRLGDDERLEFVGMIEQESLRLLRVADQMSLGLKTDAGTLPYTLVARDLEGPVLQGLHDAEVGSREVRADVEPDLRARVDERWLAEAVRQGLENAMKFSPAEATIDLRARADDAVALVEIEDRGPGIPEEMREAVFEKFCRWRPVGYEDRSGSGLGLFVVRSIAREHGGEAIILGGADGGTILQIRLPLEGAA